MIPMIKDACAVPGADIKIFSSPWSPPAWMKTNNSRTHGGSLRTEYYGTWALYVSKYLQAFAAEGINIWGITLQNEPQANQAFESTLYSAEQERDLLKILGAQLTSDNLDGVKIFVHDHNKGHLSRANTILSDAAAAKYATGIAFHWYEGDHFSNLAKIHADFPDKQLIGTEVAEPGPKYGDWGQAERGIHDLIGDVNNWASGWTEWNLVCDERGGPGWTGSVGSSPIHTDFARDSIVINPHYCYIGHFSKYVRPGAVRIGLSNTATNLEAAAFRNINGAIVVNVMNKNGSPVTFKLKQGDRIIKPTIPAHAIISFIFF
jgi:glucosylceramidase